MKKKLTHPKANKTTKAQAKQQGKPAPSPASTTANATNADSFEDVRAALMAQLVAAAQTAGLTKVHEADALVPEWARRTADEYHKSAGLDVFCKPTKQFTPYELGRFVGYWELQKPVSEADPDVLFEEMTALCDTVRARIVSAKPKLAIEFHQGRDAAEKYATTVERTRALRWMLANQSQVTQCRKRADLARMLQDSGEVITSTDVAAIESFARMVRDLWKIVGLNAAAPLPRPQS